MLDREYEILSYIRKKKVVPVLDVLNTFLAQGKEQLNEAVLQNSLRNGLIEKTWSNQSFSSCSVKITPKGILELSKEYESRLQQCEVDKKERKRNKPKQWIKNIGKICVFVAGLASFLASLVAIAEFFSG